MAVVASFALALGGPFVYELLLNRRIRCRDDLERHFRIMTLAQFGRMNPAPAALAAETR
jgi:polysaccharide biosynthesis transport protein